MLELPLGLCWQKEERTGPPAHPDQYISQAFGYKKEQQLHYDSLNLSYKCTLLSNPVCDALMNCLLVNITSVKCKTYFDT